MSTNHSATQDSRKKQRREEGNSESCDLFSQAIRNPSPTPIGPEAITITSVANNNVPAQANAKIAASNQPSSPSSSSSSTSSTAPSNPAASLSSSGSKIKSTNRRGEKKKRSIQELFSESEMSQEQFSAIKISASETKSIGPLTREMCNLFRKKHIGSRVEGEECAFYPLDLKEREIE